MKFPGFVFVIILLILSLSSCREQTHPEDVGYGPKPDSILSEQNMILLLADVHILEAGLNMIKNDGGPVEDRSAFLYEGLFRKHHTTKRLYEASLRYYNSNPQLFAKLYVRVVEVIRMKQTPAPPKH
jgi:hypothetical protein